MKIALDYDGTYTRDPVFWGSFISQCRGHGHEVRIVTARTEAMIDFDVGLPIIACGFVPKRTFCNQLGWFPDIWIDDQPEFIVESLYEIFPNLIAQL